VTFTEAFRRTVARYDDLSDEKKDDIERTKRKLAAQKEQSDV
jgi:hypothetical protein